MLGMLAQTKKGKVLRKYFLECERTAKRANKVLNTTPTPEKQEIIPNTVESAIINPELITSLNTRLDQLETINFALKQFIDDELAQHKKNMEPIFRATYECYTDAKNGDPISYIEFLKKENQELLIANEKLQKELDKPRTVELITSPFAFQTPAKEPRKNKIRVTQSSLKGKHK
jgi:hypothetical protein